MLRPCLLACALALFSGPAAAGTVTSDLYGKHCRLVDNAGPGGAVTRRCRGTAGYALLVHEHAGRSSIDIVAPDKQTYQLDVWDVVPSGNSYVGRKAEWLVEGGTARALLVRLDSVDGGASAAAHTSTAIAVARIDADGACLTFKIDARARRAEAEARKAARDRSRKCLGAYGVAAVEDGVPD